MKKGFTLVELLGVIVIIAVIATIAAIAVDNSIKKGKESTCKAQKENIIEAAKTWQIDNSITSNTQVYVNNSSQNNDLTKGGYLDENLKNPMTDEKYESNIYVQITIIENDNSDNQGYDYKLMKGNTEINCE
ncbi:MAG: prepilin-type N-terminal cleavage/methylation domain-containing protein [Bacilli bacterium]|nr:prepilin-type N-terminal cleavage/methylation domain-containing protein [Bacilli bacterium]